VEPSKRQKANGESHFTHISKCQDKESVKHQTPADEPFPDGLIDGSQCAFGLTESEATDTLTLQAGRYGGLSRDADFLNCIYLPTCGLKERSCERQ
jgi:hypothetical protein